MSDRKEVDIGFCSEAWNVALATGQIELFESHKRQIDILLDEEITHQERAQKFFIEVSGVVSPISAFPLGFERMKHCVWQTGGQSKSLFGNLPGCHCPVIEVAYGKKNLKGIPKHWNFIKFTQEGLWAFSLAQLQARAQ